MHVAIYHPGCPIPPPDYGGTERVIYWLGKALLQFGHQVTLIAAQGSQIPGAEVRSLNPNETSGDKWTRLIPDSADLLHLWATPSVALHRPFLVTIEGNGVPGQTFHPNTVFVSRKHAANHNSRHFVFNGLDPADYSFSEKRDDYALFLAKARWNVKNLEGAKQVVRAAGVELRVLGSRNWPMNLHRLLPAIRGVRYYGMIGGDEKRELLARARCLIFPVRWHEPFGVALTEALASGCFVAGTPYGSLPEIISSDVGVLSARAADLADAMRNPGRFPPATCRNRVLHGGFTHLDMAREYLRCYEAVLSRGRLGDANEPTPETTKGFLAKELLPWHE